MLHSYVFFGRTNHIMQSTRTIKRRISRASKGEMGSIFAVSKQVYLDEVV